MTVCCSYFTDYSVPDFAKAGSLSTEDVVIPPGPLPFSTSMLDQIRKLGLIVEVDNGSMVLRESFVAAKADEQLTPEQAKILAHFDRKLINFSIQLECVWEDGEFEELS